MLVKTELTATQGKEMIRLLAESPPDSIDSGHNHPGDEVVYILEGSITFTLC
jgi:quercetin dioxygenase-like cupin family protein